MGGRRRRGRPEWPQSPAERKTRGRRCKTRPVWATKSTTASNHRHEDDNKLIDRSIMGASSFIPMKTEPNLAKFGLLGWLAGQFAWLSLRQQDEYILQTLRL